MKNTALYERKIDPMRSKLPTLRYVVVIGDDAPHDAAQGVLSWSKLMSDASERCLPVA